MFLLNFLFFYHMNLKGNRKMIVHPKMYITLLTLKPSVYVTLLSDEYNRCYIDVLALPSFIMAVNGC